MAGIPASIGGAIRMNAGGAYGCIGDAVESVTCIDRSGEIVTYPKSELRFGYRETNIPDPVIISAVFNLTPDDPIKVRERVKEIFAYKKSTQPLADHSAGCTFKNPIDPVTEKRVSAGKLIDEAGMKGYSIGGASVSRQHANFILTQMEEGASYEVALRAARHLGLAERNPTADVEGFDAMAKAMILAALVFGRQLRPEDVARRGISGVDPAQIQAARSGGARVKQLVTVELSAAGGGDDVIARVEPALVERDDPLANISGVFNGLVCHADPVGEVMLAGPGAGPELAGQGVFSDLIAVAR
jgi:hypothetical protein